MPFVGLPYLVPGLLEPASYEGIARRMLTVHPNRIGAAILMPPNLSDPPRLSWPKIKDISFVRQLHQVRHPAQELGFETNESDDPQFLFTSRSALILSRAVLSLYAELGLRPPEIGEINANRANAKAYFASSQRRTEAAAQEITRLQPVVSGQPVVIVEQLVDSGVTSLYASKIAYEAGAISVAIIRGAWYSDVTPGDAFLDPPEARESAEFMTQVGREAASRYRELYGAPVAVRQR